MPDHLTPSERALREAAEKATKGEWKTDSLGVAIHTTKAAGASPGWVPVISNRVPDDAAYIVAAQPRAVLALLDEIEQLRGALDKIADERMYRSGYCQTDIAVEPALTASEAQEVARAAPTPKEKNDG